MDTLDPARVAKEEVKRENILKGVAIRDACLSAELESALRESIPLAAIFSPVRLRLHLLPCEVPGAKKKSFVQRQSPMLQCRGGIPN